MCKKTFIGMVTFNGLNFTKLAVKGIYETVKNDYKLCIIVGKPGDHKTANWCSKNNIPHIVHDQNYGFPYSLNDLYDWGFKNQDFDNYVILGNDVIPYPYAIDSMIDTANTTEYEWICAREFSVKSLCKSFPEIINEFSGNDYIFANFNSRPWEKFTKYSKEIVISKAGLSDVHNLCLYKRSVFDKIGYVDTNYYPAYFCLVPETLILTDKLKWRPLGDLNVGDGIVGVDEYPERKGASRSYRDTHIERKRELKADCLKITLSDGRSIICSKNHKLLVKRIVSNGYFWQRADKLYEKMKVCSPLSPWKTETGFDAGWLSGMYDGEGCVKKPLDSLSMYQKKGDVFDKVISILDTTGVPYSCYDRQSSTASVAEIYGKDNVLEMLGRFQPIRLVNKKTWDGARIRSKYTTNSLRIVKIEDVGEKDVIDIQVSTRAFLANGIVSHNSDNDYARRGANSKVKSCTLINAFYFHFWSRVIKQGSGGGSTSKYFEANRRFYITKWGGDFGKEGWRIPFNGKEYKLINNVILQPSLKISSRVDEKKIISYWK